MKNNVNVIAIKIIASIVISTAMVWLMLWNLIVWQDYKCLWSESDPVKAIQMLATGTWSILTSVSPGLVVLGVVFIVKWICFDHRNAHR